MVKTLEPIQREERRSAIQEEISRTYLKLSDVRKKKSPTSRVPWLVALSALAIAVAILLSKSNFDIRIRVMSEMPSLAPEGSTPDPFYNIRDRGIFLLKGSQPNKALVRSAAFAGDAEAYSAVEKEELVLRNSKGNGWASFNIELKEPIDLAKLDVKYTARGMSGDENLTLVIVDRDNRSYRLGKDISTKLTKEWEKHTMTFGHLKNAVDLKNISTIRFEFGSLSCGNYSTATILLKDVYIAKTRGLKWL